MEELPFAADWELLKEILLFKKRYNIKTIIETGTWIGNTTELLSYIFDKVITIEIDPQFYIDASRLDKLQNVTRLLGDSSEWLEKIYLYDKEYTLIFLDAHSFGHGCPLNQELEALIKNTSINKKLILVIHDCLNPHQPEFGYDTYEDKPISYELIKDNIIKLYNNNYYYAYNGKASGEKRGVMFVIPKETNERK
jgi:hypothetical protein